jgi:subtilisin-like proprotein convertase family protein
MAIRIGGDSSANQIQQQQNSSSTSRATQQPSVRENSAFQGDQLRTGTSSTARMRSAESSFGASRLMSQVAPSSKQVIDSAAARPATTTTNAAATNNVTKTATPNLAILDNKTVSSTINIPDDGNVDSISVNVDIAHTYRGDLVVKLVSPSGKEAVLTNRAGGSADNFQLSAKDLSTQFPGESIKGDWKLVVQDAAAQDTGTLKSWGLSINKKPAPGGGGGGQTGPTNLQVTGDAAFTARAAADLAKFAPGTTVDSQGYVHAATTRVAGHDQGYKLVDTLLAGGNGGNKKVTIGFVSNNAFTSSGTGAQGKPGVPSAGSDAAVSYDPALNITLPTLQPNGTIKDEGISSEVVLAHELTHAIHAQAGTIDRTLVDHTFTDGGTTYKENWRFEELRTTGFTGFRQGSEPSENSIRGELGYNARASYLDRSSWTRVNGVAANGVAASGSRAAGGEQLVGDAWRSDGMVLPNGQMRICNCFACTGGAVAEINRNNANTSSAM